MSGAISNVSTFGSLQTLLQNMSTIQNELNTDQEQLSSGQQSQTFAGISSNVAQLTSVSSQVTRLNGYTQGNQSVIAQMNVTNTVLGQILQMATNLKNTVATQMSGTSNSASFIQQIQAQMNSLRSALNTTYNSNYIFGGTNLTTPPIKTPIPAPAEIGTPDDNYYQGTAQDISFRVSDSEVINPNVRGDNMAFQQLFAGMQQAISAASGTSVDSTGMQHAEDLIDQGIQGVTALQATVNTNILNVQNIDSQNQQVQTYLNNIVSTLSSTDVVSVSTQVAQDTSILQASFAAFAQISKLSLTNYIGG